MKKSVFTRFIVLCVAAVLLCTSIAAAAISGSPYEIVKRSLLALAKAENYTADASITILKNGVVIDEEYSNSSRGYKSTYSSYENGGFYYNDENLYVSSYESDGVMRYNAGLRDSYYGSNSMLGGLSDAQIRFFELAADLAVGDLRNNLTMTEENGVRTITGVLTSAQIPELYNAGVELVFTEQFSNMHRYLGNETISMDNGVHVYTETYIRNGQKVITTYEQKIANEDTLVEHQVYSDVTGSYVRYAGDPEVTYETNVIDEVTVPAVKADYEAVLNDGYFSLAPIANAKISYVRGEGRVDDAGNIMSLNGNAVFDLVDIYGERIELEVVVEFNISDVGTADPQCPIPNVVETIKKYSLDDKYGTITFTLNPDGTINEQSIIDMKSEEMAKIEMEKAGIVFGVDLPAGAGYPIDPEIPALEAEDSVEPETDPFAGEPGAGETSEPYIEEPAGTEAPAVDDGNGEGAVDGETDPNEPVIFENPNGDENSDEDEAGE